MAKLEKLSEGMQQRLNTIVSDFQIDKFANVEAMCAMKQKTPVLVSRANAQTEFATNKPDTIYICINEPVMELLTDIQQDMLLRDALSGIYFDPEKEKLVINKPEISISMWGRMKYNEQLDKAYEAFVIANQQKEEEEKERKNAQKKQKEEL